MRCTRVELAEQEPRLRSTLITYYIPRNRETVNQQVLRICLRCFEQCLEVFVALLVLVSRLAPFGDRLTMPNQEVEKGVE